MGLKNLTLPKAIVELSGGEFAVRGLSLDDILALMFPHGDVLAQIFDKVAEKKADLGDEMIGEYAMGLVQSAPGVAAKIIVMACDESADDAEAMQIASRLPATVQLDALIKIGQLTFAAEGGLKKVVETVVMLAKGTTSLVEDLKALPNGSGSSEGK